MIAHPEGGVALVQRALLSLARRAVAQPQLWRGTRSLVDAHENVGCTTGDERREAVASGAQCATAGAQDAGGRNKVVVELGLHRRLLDKLEEERADRHVRRLRGAPEIARAGA